MPTGQLYTLDPTFDVKSWPSWTGAATVDDKLSLTKVLESGKLLLLPRLAFRIEATERRFLDPCWSDGRAKNISYASQTNAVKGAVGSLDELQALRRLLIRFHQQAIGLVRALLPDYASSLHSARTSFRPLAVSSRNISWRKDDSRLHVDAFPSRPTYGERILRVFANVNPDGKSRLWRVGEPFEALAARFWPQLKRPLPGSATLMATLRITKAPRSLYDHYMLQLHDRMKADLHYQHDVPQQTVSLPPGSVWLCFSDQTSHAAMSGQYLLEQTLRVPISALIEPEHAPLRVLERLAGHALA